jgi:demethylmenaquinone methyltransferase/2-methoxy-6-polyprenyl-1,4-benzoquinol methylase
LYLLYFKHLLPWIGRRVSRHDSAYSYLTASVLQFPSPEELTRRLEAHGFTEVRYRSLLGGICGLHVGMRHGAR